MTIPIKDTLPRLPRSQSLTGNAYWEVLPPI
ncbi:hypothetical protein NIES4074_12120 [Cylindrospermum sp. NIES-4074]|nr:hypothetical protein NIES4074_12120 [Cylindrospermum sp. NIES-4074]